MEGEIGAMIEVSPEQINQVEYLITQSEQGNHVLFDLDIVRKALASSVAYNDAEQEKNELYSSEPHIERLLAQPTLRDKKAYLSRLDPKTLNSVVRTYFNIIENNLVENKAPRH